MTQTLLWLQVTTTISRGRVVWHDGKLSVQPGTGRFVRMEPGGSLYEGLDTTSDGGVPSWLRGLQQRYAAAAPTPPPAVSPSDELREEL